jgi:preprotein translocase subunit SecD
VILYSLIYYRGLGLVSVASLAVAGALTYGSLVLLGETIGYTLSLAGVAGAIVSIGITADSFVVFFERIRDEMRDGRSMRVAVEQGWRRARRTILAADTVSFLAAVTLYLLAVGNVQGFAFTLGLTTVIDVVVVFLFTKPLLTVLARTKFFAEGNKWSGVDPDRLGITRRPAAPARRAPKPKEA